MERMNTRGKERGSVYYAMTQAGGKVSSWWWWRCTVCLIHSLSHNIVTFQRSLWCTRQGLGSRRERTGYGHIVHTKRSGHCGYCSSYCSPSQARWVHLACIDTQTAEREIYVPRVRLKTGVPSSRSSVRHIYKQSMKQFLLFTDYYYYYYKGDDSRKDEINIGM
jgi:hypothetical protein